ncbi:MAG: hypothetical protein AVDCRST_MAG61-2494 [uncultured Friedmanniella sp.]|uniref:Uridine kinase n=1 Tax=uncultured Friedmanniella sp. TaxID=335381 RepID=A0A6J4KUH9_9ACTN|nr:uridine kinase [uncultured Friedmanniella sp.]CAA9315738.1 MAG: hypothetical protein AVDCRST_MAG61-2494 [uncultured Friedmanniella sp.]
MIPPTRPDALPGLVAGALATRTGTCWVGIDGLGAAGKTTLAARVAAALPGAVVVHVDDFARPGLRGWEQDRFRRSVLEPLLAGRPARYQRRDLDTDLLLGETEVPVGVPVVVEGVAATDVRVGVPWDLTVWLEVPEAVRHARILARDSPAWLERWRTDWWPSEQAYVAEQRPAERADVVVWSADELPP